MLGGATIARLDSKLLQERRTTVRAAEAPTAHQSFAGLPTNHRDSLESRTGRSLAEVARSCLRIFTGKILGSMLQLFRVLRGSPILGRRFAGEPFESAIELRE
jgi:hypothetical protein